ncbi:MAG: GMC family oxidoreductase N-terminal domain-containing protein [Chloroflexi bacterium]|nr:GMC family oxidoreductase N-terminal domain-containing protein [Chloroflexota bacterium]
MEYDDIIVGAGSSGAVVASRLSEDPARSILLLEAGPDYQTVEQTPEDLRSGRIQSVVAHDWGFKAAALEGREIDYPRGKVTGGSSAVNSAIALRGVPEDYDEWAAKGNPEWSWAKVLPFFRKLEDDQDESGDFHGKGGPLPIRRPKDEELLREHAAFIEACACAGLPLSADFNDPESTGVGVWPRNIIDGVRISTAIAYLGRARHRLNLTIRPGCLVHRVLIEGGRAVGVEVECGGVLQRVYGKRVTLSAGAIVSPAILMRSGIGPRVHLEELGIAPVADLPVGQELIDHCMMGVIAVPKPGVADLTKPTVQAGARYTATGSSEFNDMQLIMSGNVDLSDYPDYLAIVGAPIAVSVLAGLQRPRARGKLTLTSADAHVQPRIDLDYTSDPEDLRRLIDGVRLAWKVAHEPAMAAVFERVAILTEEMMASDEALAEYVRGTVNTIYHPVATARMGPEGDAGAVVDERGRVRGIEGLWVADASIMPAIPRANTNLTCIMIGERVAEWMR